MRYLQAAKYLITQLMGIPFVHPSVNPKEEIHLSCAVAGLCWRHILCWNGASHTVKRRTAFPTWTWAGWSGAVSWTDLFTGDEMDLVSLVDDIQCEFEDGRSMTLPQYSSQSRSGKPPLPLALRFSAWLVPPNMILLDELNKTPSWKIDKFRWQLHMSDFGGSPADFIEALRIGKLECMFVAKGSFNSYFLIIEQSSSFPEGSWRRVGAAEAIWSEDKHDLCFANEVPFSGLKKAIRLV
jgi:hypothetical protein